MTTEHDAQQYPIYLFEFRYRDELTGKWRKARYRAEVHEIRERHTESQIIGERRQSPIRRSAHRPIAASISANVRATSWVTCGARPSCRAICVSEKMPRTVWIAALEPEGAGSITSAC